MKNLFTIALVAIAFISCSDSKTDSIPVASTESNVMLEETAPSNTAEAEELANASPEELAIKEGQTLVEGADCLACHKIDSKLVGPSYLEVAEKYTEADLDYLASKIIEGGQGVWGDVPMTAHAGMSTDNAQKMVKYILSLK